jgi:arylsulfatase A-like enzyme
MFRQVVSLVTAVLAAMSITACVRVATHEAGAPADQRYDGRQAGVSNAIFVDTENEPGVPDFSGTGFGKAGYTGTPSPPPTPSQAYGSFSVQESEGSYGAAFYFPPGALSGASPDQQGDVDIMRWQGSSDFGGIRIGTDHRGRLIRGNLGSGTTEQIGESFALQEGCWNWLEVAQKLRNDPWQDPGHAASEVHLNGRTVINTHRPNRYGSTGTATSVRFGIPYIDDEGQGNSSFNFYVDDAKVSKGMGFFNPSDTCMPPSPPRPNILFIVTDDQRADDTLHQMPETMKWFRDGTVEEGDVMSGGTQFDEGYVTTPLCCPSRGSILTGKYAHNHGVRRNDEADALADNAQLQTLLKAGGYRTGIAGKYLNGWNTYLDPPDFDKWWVTSPGYQPYTNDNGTITPHPHPNDTTTYSMNYVGDRAQSFIDDMEANDSDPWFLYLAPYAPHTVNDFPYTDMMDPDPLWPWRPTAFTPPPAPGYPSRSEGAAGGDPISDKPLWVQQASDSPTAPTQVFAGETTAQGGPLRDQQLRSLRSVDAMVSDVFRKLKARGEERDTLAVFISDNGQMWREHGVKDNEFGPDGCLKDQIPNTQPPQYTYRHCGLIQKDKPYTESIKVPYFMRWPASPAVKRGVDISRFVGNIDLAPTALSAAGLGSQTAQMDGRSVLDPNASRSEILTEDWETEGGGTWASLRGRDATRNYHYIEYYKQDGSTLADEQSDSLAEQPYLREYYDLNADPYELTNLFRDGNASTPDAVFVAQLSDRLRRVRLCKGANCPPSIPSSSVVDTENPRVWFQVPAPGVVVDGMVLPIADASDNVGVERIVYTRPGQSDSTTTRPGWAPQQWNTALVGTGPQTLRATAYDKAGNSSFVEVTVNVQRGFDVRALNSGAPGSQQGLIEEGDTVKYQFDRAIAPGVVVPGWDGSPMSVVARIAPDHPTERYNDVLSIDGVGNLGSLDLGRDDFWGWRFTPPGQTPLAGEHALFTSSQLRMSADQKSVTLELQGQTETMPAPIPSFDRSKMIWTPSTSICTVVTPCKIWEVKTSGELETPDF